MYNICKEGPRKEDKMTKRNIRSLTCAVVGLGLVCLVVFFAQEKTSKEVLNAAVTPPAPGEPVPSVPPVAPLSATRTISEPPSIIGGGRGWQEI